MKTLNKMDKIQAMNMLNDVITHFGKNPKELRSIGTRGYNDTCLYLPPKDKPKSIGCAIGMYLSNKTAKQLDGKTGQDIISVFESKNKKCLPKWMQKMNIKFLADLQDLHDLSEYWNLKKNKGLSNNGKEYVKRIEKEIKNGVYNAK